MDYRLETKYKTIDETIKALNSLRNSLTTSIDIFKVNSNINYLLIQKEHYTRLLAIRKKYSK